MRARAHRSDLHGLAKGGGGDAEAARGGVDDVVGGVGGEAGGQFAGGGEAHRHPGGEVVHRLVERGEQGGGGGVRGEVATDRAGDDEEGVLTGVADDRPAAEDAVEVGVVDLGNALLVEVQRGTGLADDVVEADDAAAAVAVDLAGAGLQAEGVDDFLVRAVLQAQDAAAAAAAHDEGGAVGQLGVVVEAVIENQGAGLQGVGAAGVVHLVGRCIGRREVEGLALKHDRALTELGDRAVAEDVAGQGQRCAGIDRPAGVGLHVDIARPGRRQAARHTEATALEDDGFRRGVIDVADVEAATHDVDALGGVAGDTGRVKDVGTGAL